MTNGTDKNEFSDIQEIREVVYSKGQVIIQQSIYSLYDNIFSYSGLFELDAYLRKWVKNDKISNKTLIELDTRGSGSILQGFLSGEIGKNENTAVICSSGTLNLLEYSISTIVNQNIGIPFHVAAVDYDREGKLVNSYWKLFKISRQYNVPVVFSSPDNESQVVTSFSSVVAKFFETPVIHSYDGIKSVKEFVKNENVMDSKNLLQMRDSVLQQFKVEIETNKASKDLDYSNLNKLANLFNVFYATNFELFKYSGDLCADIVILNFCSSFSNKISNVVRYLNEKNKKVASINISLYYPGFEEEIFKIIPVSAKKVLFLIPDDDEPTTTLDSTGLFSDLLASSFSNSKNDNLELTELKYPDTFDWNLSRILALFNSLLNDSEIDINAISNTSLDINDIKSVLNSGTSTPTELPKKFTLWGQDDSIIELASSRLTHVLSSDSSLNVSFSNSFDNISSAGIIKSDITVSPAYNLVKLYVSNYNNLTVIKDNQILKYYDVLKNVTSDTKILLFNSSFDPAVLENKLPKSFIHKLAKKGLELHVLNFDLLKDFKETADRTELLATQIAFWRLASPLDSLDRLVNRIITANGNDTELVAAVLTRLATNIIETSLKQVNYPESWAETEAETETDADAGLLEVFNENSLHPNTEKITKEVEPEVESISNIAKHLLFKEAYNTSLELRPDLPTKNFIVKVKENRRVTPLDYDRYIFHIEFDISGTGLKYEIGEALGVHARNNSNQVDEFIEWYGLNGDEVISVPSRENPDDLVESRTIRQALLDNIDIFGKPAKKFYEALSKFATNSKQKAALEILSTPNGAAQLKKRTEEDFVTYADILKEFTSAHPPFNDLVQIVAPMKRREYSIASSQKVHPNEVHLLVVVVDWVDSLGRRRYGQCSKFLSELPVGSELVVSVKPSVMKLPKLSTAPIILSGLGTGLAPFKAFVEEKAWQKANGQEIGEVYLYLGSRHQREEYLYGELWEAYKDEGIITHIGAAFSRDQPEKIYIQDRMRESIKELGGALVKKEGAFYLCGPTWPVPDVTNVLEDVIKAEAEIRGDKVDSKKAIEELKENDRYVLEVY